MGIYPVGAGRERGYLLEQVGVGIYPVAAGREWVFTLLAQLLFGGLLMKWFLIRLPPQSTYHPTVA